jgi:A/G-specific adenine glycosylase
MKITAARVRRKQEGSRGAGFQTQDAEALTVPGSSVAARLLEWYARHRRRLPWRAEPGEPADPYRVWLSEIMLQQTTVKAVIPYFERFQARWPDAPSLAAAALDDVLAAWAGLGYYARARNLHRCAQAVTTHWGGQFPSTEEALRTLPGIGRYTAAAIAAIAFDRQATPVDGNIERVVARLFAIADPLPAARQRIQALAESITPVNGAGDFAQALMDLGTSICTPRRPTCSACPIASDCVAHRVGDPEALPRKTAKAAGRLRRGAAFVVVRADGRILLRTRPSEGLLGGMSEVPTSVWDPAFEFENALADAPRLTGGSGPVGWARVPGIVRHIFTHFPLELVVFVAQAPASARPAPGMRWVACDRLETEALPSVMRKVLAHALTTGGARRSQSQR